MYRSGTAYGLDTDRREHWSQWAECRTSPELWFAETAGARAAALHVCLEHCPVLEQCRRDAAEAAARREHRSLVVGGVSYNHAGRDADALPAAACARCHPPVRYPHEGKHGTAAAVKLHQQRGEPLCWQCHGGDRDRKRRTDRRRRARAARVAAWNERWPEGGPRDVVEKSGET
jgi:hypothetical protein